MPQAPMIPASPGLEAQQEQASPVSPATYLMAAANLHKQGALTQPPGDTKNPAQFSHRSRKRLQVVK